MTNVSPAAKAALTETATHQFATARGQGSGNRFGDSGEVGWARLGVSTTLVKVLADMVEHAMKGDGEGPGDAVESAPRAGAKGGSAT